MNFQGNGNLALTYQRRLLLQVNFGLGELRYQGLLKRPQQSQGPPTFELQSTGGHLHLYQLFYHLYQSHYITGLRLSVCFPQNCELFMAGPCLIHL